MARRTLDAAVAAVDDFIDRAQQKPEAPVQRVMK
jgi:hypothetical protein